VIHKLKLVSLVKQDLSITNGLIEPTKFYQHESNTTVERSSSLPLLWQAMETTGSRRRCAQTLPRLEKTFLVRCQGPKGGAPRPEHDQDQIREVRSGSSQPPPMQKLGNGKFWEGINGKGYPYLYCATPLEFRLLPSCRGRSPAGTALSVFFMPRHVPEKTIELGVAPKSVPMCFKTCYATTWRQLSIQTAQ
jgi:hypothetical protein